MKVFFFLAKFISPTRSNYDHNIVALAEGFKQLKYEFYGNIDYWYSDNNFLIKKAPDNYQSDINIFSAKYIEENLSIINKLQLFKVNILIDSQDGFFTLSNNKLITSKFDIILRSHYNSLFSYKKNVYPWAFGLTNRIINELNYKNNKLEHVILDTFRIPHNLRKIITNKYYPLIKDKYPIEKFISDTLDKINDENLLSYWSQTGRRHNHLYYEKLNQSLFINSVGGILDYKPIKHNLVNKFIRKIYKFLSNELDVKYKFIYQFDSWRLWEGFASNACPIHVDLNYWNLKLPVMPINRVHYWGIKGEKFNIDAEELSQTEVQKIISIAQEGKKWVFKHYSPIATSKRLINIINRIK